MKILVPVKQVQTLEQDVEIEEVVLDGAALDPDAGEWELNEWDLFSLEAALQISESVPGSEVVVATVGGQEAQDGLLVCLANGADRAVRVQDEAAGGDPLAIATVLAALARRESPDLLLCGVQSADCAQAATGVALAGLLDLARVAVVNRIELEDERSLRVQRELEGGAAEVLSLGLPALLTVQTGINEPRYATLRAIKQARSKPQETLSLADLGLEADGVVAAQGARLIALEGQSRETSASMLDGGPSEIATQILEIVREAVR